MAIETCLKLRLIYHMALRQTQGFVASIFHLLDLRAVPVPHYSTLSRRPNGLLVDLSLFAQQAIKPTTRLRKRLEHLKHLKRGIS